MLTTTTTTTTSSVQLHALHFNATWLIEHVTTQEWNSYSNISTLKPLKKCTPQQISLLNICYLFDGCGNMIPKVITWLHQPITKTNCKDGEMVTRGRAFPVSLWGHLIELRTNLRTCWHTVRHLNHWSQCVDSDYFMHSCANTVKHH